MEDKSKYFVVKQKAVPEVLLKVVEAKKRAIVSAMQSAGVAGRGAMNRFWRSEEHTSELQSL